VRRISFFNAKKTPYVDYARIGEKVDIVDGRAGTSFGRKELEGEGKKGETDRFLVDVISGGKFCRCVR